MNNGMQCEISSYLQEPPESELTAATVLGLLHARAHHLPSEFALFDEDTLHFGIVAGGIHRYRGFNCAMVTFGNEDTYGRVLEYSECLDESDKNSPDGAAMEHILRESMTFGTGLVVLETQDKLMDFLLAVVSKILCDLDLNVLTPVPPIPAPEIKILDTIFQWKSSARANAMRPYGAPPVFSIDDIAALIDSQYELAAQHLGDLRTDPIYLAETLQSYYDHRIETFLNRAPPALIQNRATTMMLTDAYTFFAYYHIAREIIDDFRRVVQRSFPNGVERAHELPEEYENAVFEILEHRVSKVHHQTICASPALRASCQVQSNDPYFAKHEMAFTPKRGDMLFTYLIVLLQEDQTHLWQVTRLFDGIDRTTEDPAQHHRVSSLLAKLLSQWGVISDCKSILESHRPAVQSEGMERVFPLKHLVYPKGPCDAAWARRCQHVDEAFAAFSQPKAGAARPKPLPDALLPFGGAAQTPIGTREEPQVVKAKRKTRGIPSAEVDVDSNRPDQKDDVAAAAVPPTEEIALQNGSVAWKDIQMAFAQLDFTLQKMRGSAWTFRHPDGHRSVTIHKPHPEPTMQFWEARRFGRRLTKRFEWTLDSFVLDPKLS
ncbi:hypothetical protein FB451DRAFT_1178212 [Mycena latifolia]|nr:hypothetical protein FB451DRAFT_1178212 [Mycena latifolia]